MAFYLNVFLNESETFKKLLQHIFELIKNSKETVKRQNTNYLVVSNEKKLQDFLIVCTPDFSEVAICIKPTSDENTNFSITLKDIEEDTSKFEDLFFYSKVLYLSKKWEKSAKYARLTAQERNAISIKAREEKDFDTLFELADFLYESMNAKLFLLDNYYVLSGLIEALKITDHDIWELLLNANKQQQQDYTNKSITEFKEKCATIHQTLVASELENSVKSWEKVNYHKEIVRNDRNDGDNDYFALLDEATGRKFLGLTSQNHDVIVYQEDGIKAVFYASHPDYGYVNGYSDYSRFSSWQYMQEYINQILSAANNAKYAFSVEHLSKGCAYLEVNNEILYSSHSLITECFAIDANIF